MVARGGEQGGGGDTCFCVPVCYLLPSPMLYSYQRENESVYDDKVKQGEPTENTKPAGPVEGWCRIYRSVRSVDSFVLSPHLAFPPS